VDGLTERIRAALAARPEIELAILFGSMAAGRANERSDIDLAVRFQPGKEHQGWDFGGLISALELELRRPVQLVDLGRVESSVLMLEISKGLLVKGDWQEFVAFKVRAFRTWREYGPRFRRMARALIASIVRQAETKV
jgi:predicted nucleotidyltransferase